MSRRKIKPIGFTEYVKVWYKNLTLARAIVMAMRVGFPVTVVREIRTRTGGREPSENPRHGKTFMLEIPSKYSIEVHKDQYTVNEEFEDISEMYMLNLAADSWSVVSIHPRFKEAKLQQRIYIDAKVTGVGWYRTSNIKEGGDCYD